MKILLECNETNVNVVNQEGKSSLHFASENGNPGVLGLLLDQPLIDVNQVDDEGQTPLIAAVEYGCSGAVKLLLAHADLNLNKEINTTGSTALQMAANVGNIEITELLVKHPSIEVNKGNNLGETALILASRFGQIEVVKILIGQDRIDINRATKNRKTALMVAALNRNTPVVKTLLAEPGIEVNFATFDGKTALIYATLKHETEIVTLFLRCPGTDTEMVDENYKTALQYAKMNGSTNIVDAFDFRGKLIMQNGHTCCSELIDRGLITAVELHDDSSVKMILKCPQLDINTANEMGYTSLFLAARANQKENVEILSASPGIEINKKVVLNKETPLMVSADEGNPDIVRLLLAHVQIDTNQVDSHGISALQKAMKRGEVGHLRVTKLFLRCPMTIIVPEQHDVQNDIVEAINLHSMFLEMTPTCCKNVYIDCLSAAYEGDFRGIEGILRCPNSNINVVDREGRTPLFLASVQGHLQAVKVLLANSDIDINIGLPKSGATAFSIASERNHFKVMKEIIKKGESGFLHDGWCSDNWTPQLILCNTITTEEITLPTNEVTGK